jgi:hypothetical protein
MGFQEMVYRRFEHKRVVDGDISNMSNAEPTWLAPSRDRLVHDIVRDQKEGLELSTHVDTQKGDTELNPPTQHTTRV